MNGVLSFANKIVKISQNMPNVLSSYQTLDSIYVPLVPILIGMCF